MNYREKMFEDKLRSIKDELLRKIDKRLKYLKDVEGETDDENAEEWFLINFKSKLNEVFGK